jgi:hypothetical protein
MSCKKILLTVKKTVFIRKFIFNQLGSFAFVVRTRKLLQKATIRPQSTSKLHRMKSVCI